MLGPVLESLEKRAEGRWRLVKINVDEQQDLAQQFRIMGIPAVKLVQNGQVVDEFSGVHPEEAIENWLNQRLGVKTS
jgi:putative thioredoxin